MVVVEDGNIELVLNEEDAVTSDGVTLNPDDSIVVSSPDDRTFRVMDVEFEVVGADTVTVTFTRPGDDDEVRTVWYTQYQICFSLSYLSLVN